VVIKRSSAREIDALLGDLDAESNVRRETAVVRLSVIGARAASALLEVLRRHESPRARVAALQALDAVQDVRVLEAALACLDDPDSALAVQAAAVARKYLGSRDGPRVIDRLAAIAVDASRDRALRLAALDALSDMPARTVRPIWCRLQDDADGLVKRRARLALGLPDPEPDPLIVIEAAAAGTLPEDPRTLQAAIAAAGGPAPLPTLHRVLEVLRGFDREGGGRSRDAAWYGARGALHQALASRGSTVALYDLREAVEHATEPLPAEYLTALAAIGDRTCLDAIAGAYGRAPRAPGAQDWWRTLLAGAFHDIVRREGLTERHAAIKQVRSRWPEAARALLGPPRRASR
jgi:hypothetical protein